MPESQFNEHIEAEIRELEKRLEAKKRQLGVEHEPREKEVFREVFRERFDELAKSIQQGPKPSVNPSNARNEDSGIKDLKKEEEVERLLYAAFEKNPQTAIEEAWKLGGEYLLDELHDRLSNEYYEKLLEFRKIQEL